LKTRKVSNYEAGDFSVTKEFKVLHCGDPIDNHNKFYCIELQQNPKTDEHRIMTNYGRLGRTSVFEVRESPYKVDTGGLSELRHEFNLIVDSKLKHRGGDKDYKYELVETTSPNIGSSNIRNKAVSITTKSLIDFSSVSTNPIIIQLLKEFHEENIHQITGLTSLKYGSSGLETPLGPLTPNQLSEARSVLMELKQRLSNKLNDLLELNRKYYSLIPHEFGMKVPKEAFLQEEAVLMTEFDLLDQMEAALQVTSNKDDQKSLGFKLNLCDESVVKNMQGKFMATRSVNHRHLFRYKVTRVYIIENTPAEKERWEKVGKNKQPILNLWHGSRNCNILSILLNGLIILGANASHVTGRMFGNGVYGAMSSTKSLNYSVGYWNGLRNRYPKAYMFAVDFGMGRIHETITSFIKTPTGIDSVHAKAGRELQNDEFIVYDEGQVITKYLVELEEN
jgi:poly [ADP-ribose] polymerase